MVVPAADRHRLVEVVAGQPERVVVEAAGEVAVVEVLAGVEDGAAAVAEFEDVGEVADPADQLGGGEAAAVFDVDDGGEVPGAEVDGGEEVAGLLLGGNLRAEEMVGAAAQAGGGGVLPVAVEVLVAERSAFGCLHKGEGRTGGGQLLPVDRPLVVANVHTEHLVAIRHGGAVLEAARQVGGQAGNEQEEGEAFDGRRSFLGQVEDDKVT